MQETETESRQ